MTDAAMTILCGIFLVVAAIYWHLAGEPRRARTLYRFAIAFLFVFSGVDLLTRAGVFS